MTTSPTALLSAVLRESEIEVALAIGGDSHGARHVVAAADAMQLGGKIERVLSRACVHGGGNRDDAEELSALCTQWTNVTLSGEQRDKLGTVADDSLALRLDRSLEGLPWELMRIEDGYLCLRMGVGRVPDIAAKSHRSALEDGTIRVAIVANPEFNLPAASREADALRRFFSRNAATRRPRILSNRVNREQLFEAFEKADWLHFAGHARLEGGMRQWQLADGSVGATELASAEVTSWPRFVFGHACGSAQSAATIGLQRESGQTIPEALLTRGVGHYLGTIAPVLDEDCLRFVEDFYAALTDGCNVGAALCRAQRQFVDRFGPERLLWACYRLYGDPAAALVPGQLGHGREDRSDAGAPEYAGPEPPLPAECGRCGKVIRTRHGVGEVVEKNGVPCAICRRCARDAADASGSPRMSTPPHDSHIGKPPSAPDTGPEASSPPQPAEGTLSAEEGRRRELNFVGRFTQAAERFSELTDPASGRRSSVTLVLKESGSGRDAAPALRLREREDSRRHLPREEFRRFELTGYRPSMPGKGRLQLLLQVMCRRRQYEETGGDGAPLTVTELMDRLAESSSESPQIVFLASPTGWTGEAVAYIVESSNDSFYDPSRAVILVDLAKDAVFFRRDDLRLMPFAPLMDLEDEGSKVQRVAQNIRGRLPLATSLAAATVASELDVPLEVVETAFRLVAAEESLTVEQVESFGLVLSQPHV